MIDDWLQQANCRGLPPSMFVFDESRGMMTTGMRRQIAQAKAICNECTVTAECLAYGNQHDLRGIWGGYTGRERRTMMRTKEGVGARGPFPQQQGWTGHVHGTPSGYLAHLKYSTEPCTSCREARNAYVAETRPSRARVG